ncbi:MAG TPA: undecaprenyl-diphosphate phosphatase [Burkholderiaceae bacterium]|nr:undecaprenyl-diphosphate phosphatase [Burkholderiaceae bacterium]
MDLLYALPLLVKAALLGIVEGLTEFLPISSTGHLILAGSLLGWNDDKAKVFDVAIQTGAMAAVIWYYRARIAGVLGGLGSDRTSQRFALNVVVAFLPAAVLGVIFGSHIKAVLFEPVPVALAFIVGGVVILWVERAQKRAARAPRVDDIDSLTLGDALKLGLAQAFSLVPGTSRSGATIIGGMIFGLSRRVATEFSFFLAIPTLIGAGVYQTWKYRDLLSAADAPLFGVGLITAFFSALACVHWLIRYVSRHDFVPFAWYRIAFGLVVLVTAWTGVVDWSAG